MENKKKIILISILAIVMLIGWKIADYFVCKSPDEPLTIPNASHASFYTTGYECGWSDHNARKEFDPQNALNSYYAEFGKTIYTDLQGDYVAAFSAGYGYGYYDQATGRRTNQNGYKNWSVR